MGDYSQVVSSTAASEESWRGSSKNTMDPNDQGMRTKPKRAFCFSRATCDILFSCLVVLIPILGFSIAIIYIVFHYWVDTTNCPFPELCSPLNTINERGAVYYLNFPATRLVFIASWSSSLSFALAGVLMGLFSWPLAYRLLKTNPSRSERAAFTPRQAGLLVNVLNGSQMPVLRSLFPRLRWFRRSSPSAAASPVMSSLTVFFIVLVLA